MAEKKAELSERIIPKGLPLHIVMLDHRADYTQAECKWFSTPYGRPDCNGDPFTKTWKELTYQSTWSNPDEADEEE